MKPVTYYSTNNKLEVVDFQTALLKGMASNYGLYMMDRKDIPKLSLQQIKEMAHLSYAQIAFMVLNPFLTSEIPSQKLEALLEDAYNKDKIPTQVDFVKGKTHIMWLTKGPTYSFKDYAARFFGRTLNYFLGEKNLKRTVMVATSGDTGGAVADALHGLNNVENIVFFPKDSISAGQRRQMTTLHKNIYAFEVNGDFDVCQALIKTLLGDKKFAGEIFKDEERFTSANSISIGRLLPQAVYPFFAYSKIAENGEPMITSVPSGNFGDMMGTLIAKEMGLPISSIVCGVNENTAFPDFLETGEYVVKATKHSPSSAMNVSHPSNLARLVDFYGGHMYDERDMVSKKVIRDGVIDIMPDLKAMKKDIISVGVTNSEHYQTIQDVYVPFNIILDPHGAVGWRALQKVLGWRNNKLSVVYETADPGKFPEDIHKAINIFPDLPEGMKKQAKAKERIYSIISEPERTPEGKLKLSEMQIEEAKSTIRKIFSI
ncbi:MAG: threonine synthase [Candidatus Nanoarchaeia archaeon]|nr:threonine synthase [Candidatus Nanoarchaeia archaeon]MDD5587494.1 threonine synthase [Candidatus Nanoarchaeia archaeon]